MVKLVGPFHSDDARGKFGDCLVFSGWRGIAVGRAYKVPKNPQTDPQMQQRGYQTSAVLNYHLIPGTDLAAWTLRAAGKKYSGFNLYVKLHVDANVALTPFNTIMNVVTTAATTTCQINLTMETTVSTRAKVGITAGSWTMSFDSGKVTTTAVITATGLSSGSLYFFMLESLDSANPGSTGYYSFITA